MLIKFPCCFSQVIFLKERKETTAFFGHFKKGTFLGGGGSRKTDQKNGKESNALK